MTPVIRSLPPVDDAEKREALERVLASRTFKRSDQLKVLLRYICEAEISGRGESLSEYTVAVEGLRRPSDYSALEDGAARNRIHALRQRLEQYYKTSPDPVQIVLPKGTYRPAFERVIADRPSPSAAELVLVDDRSRPASTVLWKRRITLGTAGVICALAMLMTAGAVMLTLRGERVAPVLAEAWGPLLANNGHPLICIATQAQIALTRRPYSETGERNIATDELMQWYQGLGGLAPGQKIFSGRSLNSPFWGDAAGALAAGRILSLAGAPLEVLPEAAVQLPALSKRNVLLFGRPSYSNAVELYLRDMPFSVFVGDERQAPAIRNVSPKNGEPGEYEQTATSRNAYGLITVTPNGADGKLRTVVFSGLLSPGAEAASEFFASERHMLRLESLFRKEGFAGFPPSYQVVVRCNVFDAAALDVEYVAHRAVAKRD